MAIIYAGGFFVTWVILYFRVGFRASGADWREYLLSSPTWFLVTTLKLFGWPITLIAWLVNGASKISAWQAISVIDGKPVRKIVRTEHSVITRLLESAGA